MRFPTAWAKVAAENVTLKVATITLAIVCVTGLFTISSLASKPPLIVERGCYSKSLSFQQKGQPTSEEIKAFIAEAIPLRFDSKPDARDGYLSLAEIIAREKEIATLSSRQMTQRVLVNDIKIIPAGISVFADRLVAIGKVKSVLSLNLKVVIQETARSENNPYGLILSSVSPLEDKDERKQ